MIHQSVIEELKMRNNIEDVVSSYVRLTRSGQNLKGLCPFHSEKTPSFTVFAGEGNFYCFGCGAGGDVITFIMKAENLAYPEALEFLANRVGMELPKDYRNKDEGMSRSEIVSMNREAAKYFYSCLMNPKTPQGLEYFTKKRGFSLPLIKRFGMGYAPEGWNGLRDHLKSKGYSYEQMLQANLIQKSREKESYYDVFRNRVMVPILDVSGNVIAFGGRLLEDGKQPKYLNTSDTPAFRKSKNLFALNFAKDYCSDRMILCEGYMDVIALHGAGFSNAVATLGTAMTPDHARMMKRYTKSVVISYDADTAGQNAADKAFRLLGEVGLEARLLKVENAKDPDEFIKKFGKDAFRKLLDGSKPQFEFKFDRIAGKYNLNSLEDKIKASGEVARLIATFPSSVERELYISRASERLGVQKTSLSNDVERLRRAEQRKQKNEHAGEILRQAQGYSDRVNPQIIGNVGAARAEEAILGLLLLKNDVAERVFREKSLSEEDFVTDFHKRVFLMLKEAWEAGEPPELSTLSDRLSADEIGRLMHLKLQRAELEKNDYGVFLECVNRLRESAGTKDTPEDIRAILEKKRSRKN